MLPNICWYLGLGSGHSGMYRVLGHLYVSVDSKAWNVNKISPFYKVYLEGVLRIWLCLYQCLHLAQILVQHLMLFHLERETLLFFWWEVNKICPDSDYLTQIIIGFTRRKKWRGLIWIGASHFIKNELGIFNSLATSVK